MRVRDVMTREVVTVPPSASFKDVAECLLQAGVSGVPVVDHTGAVIGVVTEADLVSKALPHAGRRSPMALLADYFTGHDPRWLRKASGLTARQVMTADPLTTLPAEDVSSAVRRMLEHGVNRLPVVEDGRLVGIITRRDVLGAFDRSDAEIEHDVEVMLGDPLRAPEGHHVHVHVHEGVVHLEGSVHTPSDADVVRGAVRRVRGVIDVVDHLVFELWGTKQTL